MARALSGIAIQPNDRLEGLRRYIPARAEVRQGWAVDREVFGNLLFVRSTDITATHLSHHRAHAIDTSSGCITHRGSNDCIVISHRPAIRMVCSIALRTLVFRQVEIRAFTLCLVHDATGLRYGLL
jgi:hypothetical protein